jgi:hypothetical protein
MLSLPHSELVKALHKASQDSRSGKWTLPFNKRNSKIMLQHFEIYNSVPLK